MIFFYRILTFFLFPIFIAIIYLRRFFKKEDQKRFKEKIFVQESYFPKDKKVFWIHAASIGETNSVLPLINEILKNNEKIFILLTTTTLSSKNLIDKKKLDQERFQHRFFTLDVQFLVENFLNHWNPELIMFVDSEVWPNYLMEISRRNTPLVLLNGRITLKTFKRWKLFPHFSKKLFSLYDLCLSSSKESEKNLVSLGAKNVKYIGNLKFCPTVNIKKNEKNLKYLLNSQYVWCAASTHPNEEEIILKTHCKIKQSGINVSTIIIPRHITRSKEINEICNSFKLKSQVISNSNEISKESEILIVNSIGEMIKYFYNCKSIFMGKSFAKKLKEVGGQNPIEAAKCGCKIYHGPYVSNFTEIFDFLNSKKIAQEVTSEIDLSENLIRDFKNTSNFYDKNIEELNNHGIKILSLTIKEVLKFEK